MVALCSVTGMSQSAMQGACTASLRSQDLYGARAAILQLEWSCLGVAASNDEGQSARLGPLAIVADCHLHDREELAATFGLRARAVPDAELILALWDKNGPAAAGMLSGSFAFIVADNRDRTLYLVRDLAGSRPLCFARSGDVLACASMPSGLSQFTSGEPDVDYMAARLGGRNWTGDRTHWRDVRLVPPASMLASRNNDKTLTRHFDPSGVIKTRRDHAELADELRERLDRAVDSALRGTGRTVATHLSSGLDSSAVATSAAASKSRPERLIAYTSAPSNDLPQLVGKSWLADESVEAAETARMAGIDHVVIRDRTRIVDAIRGMARFFQDSSPNPLNHGWWIAINRHARAEGADVVLTAFFGNPTISYGGLPGLSGYLARGRVLDWSREAYRAWQANPVSIPGVLFASAEPWMSAWLAGRLRHSWLRSPPFHESSFVRAEALKRIEPHSEPWRMRFPDQVRERANLFWINDTGFRNAGMEALTGIRERDPTIDRRLVEFCFSLPPEALVSNGQLKPLIKRALAGRVPEQVLHASKRGFQGADWFGRISQSEARGAFDEISASSTAAELIDLGRLRDAIDAWPKFDPARAGDLLSIGRHLTNALADGLFLAEVERYPLAR